MEELKKPQQLLSLDSPNIAAPHVKCADSSGTRRWHEGHFAGKPQQGEAFPISFIWTSGLLAAVPSISLLGGMEGGGP